MLYLEDYLELIEHLPQELRDRLTLIRENDLKVNNACSQIDATAKQFFAEAENSNLEQRQCDYEKILKEYEKTIGYADEKVQLSDQTHGIIIKLIERLDGELEKFKLELEAAALSSAIIPATQNSISISNLMDSPSIQNNKISTNTCGKGSRDLIDPTYPLVRQDPLAAAASQAIAATQQLHQGRRTSSLKASFAAINRADGLTPDLLNCKELRNALAPMASDQQAYRFNQQPYGKLKRNGSSSPLYVSVTKSGRPSKRPKHHASHLYPIESPLSISSDNSVFENSESMSSADFIDAGNTFGSVSSSSFDFHNGSRTFSDQSDAGNGTLYHHPDQTKYCICQQTSYGEMVACDNEDCAIEWFHYGCVGISNPPKGKWFCPKCKPKMSSNQQRHNGSDQQAQTCKKRGREEILGN